MCSQHLDRVPEENYNTVAFAHNLCLQYAIALNHYQTMRRSDAAALNVKQMQLDSPSTFLVLDRTSQLLTLPHFRTMIG
jgi:hypothetical protein